MKYFALGSVIALAGVILLVPPAAFSKGGKDKAFDNYSKESQLDYYGPDRSEAPVFGLGKIDGRKCLQFTVGHDYGDPNGFYNFQGYIRWADTAHSEAFDFEAPASVHVDIYVPEEWAGDVIRGADLWVRIDDPDWDIGSDPYPTAGFYNYADGNGTAFSVFEGYSGDIIDYYDVDIRYGDWNRVEMVWDVSGLYYYCNNELVHVDDAAEYAGCIALTAAFLQGWRATDLEEDYDVAFDDLKMETTGKRPK